MRCLVERDIKMRGEFKLEFSNYTRNDLHISKEVLEKSFMESQENYIAATDKGIPVTIYDEDPFQVNLQSVVGFVDSVDVDADKVYVSIVENTPCGRAVREMMDAGANFGLSIRGVYNEQDSELKIISCGVDK